MDCRTTIIELPQPDYCLPIGLSTGGLQGFLGGGKVSRHLIARIITGPRRALLVPTRKLRHHLCIHLHPRCHLLAQEHRDIVSRVKHHEPINGDTVR